VKIHFRSKNQVDILQVHYWDCVSITENGEETKSEV